MKQNEAETKTKTTYYFVWHCTRRVGEFTPVVWHADLWHNKQYHSNEKRSALTAYVYPLNEQDELDLMASKYGLDLLAMRYPGPRPSENPNSEDN